MAKARPKTGASQSNRYYKRVRYLAIIDAAAGIAVAVVVACVITAAAPARVVPAGLPLASAWSRDYPGTAPVSAAASDGGWLVAGFVDHLEIVSIDTGEPLGSLPLPAVHLACNASICVAGDNTTTRAVDLARKTVRWQQPTPGPLAFAPTLRSGWVFLTTTDGHIAALRDTDGVKLWTFAAPAALTGPPSVDGDRIAIATANAAITLLDLRTGRVVWTTPLAASDVPGAPRLGGGMIYVGTENRELLFIDADDGHVKDIQRSGATIVGAPALDEHLVYTVSQDGVLRGFHRSSGALQWHADLPTRPANSGPVAEQNLTTVALRSGAFHVFLSDANGNAPAAIIPPPGVADSTVLLLVPPIIAGAGSTTRLITISVSVGDYSKWTAAVTTAVSRMPLSALPTWIPGLPLTLTAPR